MPKFLDVIQQVGGIQANIGADGPAGSGNSDLPDDYPLGLSIHTTAASAQGWPLGTGERAVLLTIKGTDVTAQLMFRDRTHNIRFRINNEDANTWGSWLDVI